MKKKIFTTVIALFAIASAMRAQFTPPEGDGTIDHPFIIMTADQLAALGSQVDGVHYEMSYAKLGQDIDLGTWIANNTNEDIRTNGWNPPDAYRKTFDGDNFTIRGLWSNRPGNSVGLFYQIQSQDDENDPGYTGACVKNLNIEIDSRGIIGGDNVGGLVARVNKANSAPVTISNVHVYGGSVTGTSAVGGVVGRAEEAFCIIDGCSAEGVEIDVSPTVLSGSNFFGGIIGQKDGGTGTLTIENSHFSGTINGWSYCGGIAGISGSNSKIDNCYVDETTVVNGLGDNIGGLLGAAGQNDNNTGSLLFPIVIQNSYSKAAVNCGRNTAGGLIGALGLQTGDLNPSADPRAAAIDVLNCYAEGDVTLPNGNNCAGLIGSINEGVKGSLIDNCHATGTLSGQDMWRYVGGLIADCVGHNITVQNSYYEGVINKTDQEVGGLIGRIGAGEGDKSTVLNCHASGKVLTANPSSGGLIGIYRSGGDITNCYFKSEAGWSLDGGLIGSIQETGNDATLINNCRAELATADGSVSQENLGGLIYQIASGNVTIKNSYATGDLPGVYHSEGGLVAIVTPDCASLTIDSCYYSGAIAGGGGGDDASGGLVGRANNSNTTITNSNALGSVTSGGNAGGIIGFFSGGSIQKCFSTCAVTGNGDTGGGIAGNITAPVTIEQCYATGNVTGGKNTGGIAGLIRDAAGADISECYASGEANTIYGGPAGGLVGQVQDGGSLTLDKSFALNLSVSGNATGVLVGAGSIATSTNNSALESLNDGVANTNGSPAFIDEPTAKTESTYTDAGWDFDAVWGMEADGYPVFKTGGAPLIIGPTETKTATDYTSGGYTDIIIQSSEDATGKISTGQLDLEGGSLTVNGVVKFEQAFAAGKWYAVGFPFKVASANATYLGVDYKLWTYDENHATGDDSHSSGDFWLKTYDGEAFEYYNGATGLATIDKGGYVLQVPSGGLDGLPITFTSESGITLDASTPFASVPNDSYVLTNNPSFKNVDDLSSTGALDGYNYYTYGTYGDSNFGLNHSSFTLRPFESLVISNNVTGSLRSSLGIDNITALPALNLPDDKVVATEYYNLMGVKVAQPAKGNIYVIKTIFESGKTSVVKQFIENN